MLPLKDICENVLLRPDSENIQRSVDYFNNGFTDYNNTKFLFKDFEVLKMLLESGKAFENRILSEALDKRQTPMQPIELRTFLQNNKTVYNDMVFGRGTQVNEIATTVPTNNPDNLYVRHFSLSNVYTNGLYSEITDPMERFMKLWEFQLVQSARSIHAEANARCSTSLTANLNTLGGLGTAFPRIGSYNDVAYSQYKNELFLKLKEEALKNRLINGFTNTLTPERKIKILGSTELQTLYYNISYNGANQAVFSAEQLNYFDVRTSADILNIGTDKALFYMLDPRYYSYVFWNMPKNALTESGDGYSEEELILPSNYFSDFPFEVRLSVRSKKTVEDRIATELYEESKFDITQEFMISTYLYPIFSTTDATKRGIVAYRVTNT